MTEMTRSETRVETGSSDIEGCLMFADGALCAVMVRLGEDHGDMTGSWFVEAGFGQCSSPTAPIFPDLDLAEVWILDRIEGAVRLSTRLQ